jgi:hypothetical protein
MKQSIVLSGILVLGCAASAFGQAAAESVMIHSMSAGAAAKAGTSLGRSTNSAASRLGGRLGNTMSNSTSPRSSGSGRAMIRRAAPAASGAAAQIPCAQPDPKPAGQTQANVKQDCQTKAPSQADQDKAKYKKFVTLTFDK